MYAKSNNQFLKDIIAHKYDVDEVFYFPDCVEITVVGKYSLSESDLIEITETIIGDLDLGLVGDYDIDYFNPGGVPGGHNAQIRFWVTMKSFSETIKLIKLDRYLLSKLANYNRYI